MLDHDQAVSPLDQRMEDAEQLSDVVPVEPRRRFVEEEERPGLAGKGAEVADELEPLGFAAAQRVQGLAERQVAEPDRVEERQAVAYLRRIGEEGERLIDAQFEHPGDRRPVPFDGEDLGLEPAPLADGARHEDIREELHLHALVSEPLAMVAAAVPAVEREAGGPEPRLLGPGRGGKQLPDEVPRLDVEGRV